MEKVDKPKKQKEPGYYIGTGVAIGVGLGVAFGSILENVGIGVALGTSIGVAIGTMFEESAKKRGEIRELTEEEKRKNQKQEKYVLMGFGIFVLAILALGLYFFNT